MGNPGQGFSRRVSQANLDMFAPLLRDIGKKRQQTESEEEDGSGSRTRLDPAYAAAAKEFTGSKFTARLPYTFPRGAIGTITVDTAAKGIMTVGAVLVAEIPGGRRWKQAAFTKQLFTDFFGGRKINLTHLDADGSRTLEPGNPITKTSSNYCYELGAAHGSDYPTNGRPIAVFLKLSESRFEYRLVMPGELDYAPLDKFLAVHWQGPAGRMRRFVTDLPTLTAAWPWAPFLPPSEESPE